MEAAATAVDLGSIYAALPQEQASSKKWTCKECADKCKAVARKTFDVICLMAGLGMMAFGSALVIGEKAKIEPNRGAGLGFFFLGAIIARGNGEQIRNWR